MAEIGESRAAIAERAAREARLFVTERCQRQDLKAPPDASLDELAARYPIVQKFIELRSSAPEGQEIIQAVGTSPPVYSLHSGRVRAATYHDRGHASVWLLASEVHRAGDRKDAYPHVETLHDKGQLLPTVQDLERARRLRQHQVIPMIIAQLTAALEAARDDLGQEQVAFLPNGLTAAVVVQVPDETELAPVEYIWLAVDATRLENGSLQIVQGTLAPGDATPWEYRQDFPGRGPNRLELRFRAQHELPEDLPED
jgi:hypothetical protein